MYYNPPFSGGLQSVKLVYNNFIFNASADVMIFSISPKPVSCWNIYLFSIELQNIQ